ncbi:MAG: phosphoribosylglycinamide formyltransferase [Pseudomonadota bacterium]
MAERARVAILISGRGSNMAALLYASRADDCPYEVALVSGDRPNAPGLDLAEAEGISILRLDSKKSGSSYWNELQTSLEKASIDVVALAGFMRIIPADFVERWAGRMINIHPSLLPKYRGLHTHQSAIDNRDSVTGATVHLVTSEVDSGAILSQVEVAILPDDTAEALASRVLIAEHQLYARTLSQFVSRERDPDWIVERVGQIAFALPETRFKTSHGAPGWKVGSPSSDKFFAIMWMKHHGEESVAVLVKCGGQDEMATLIEADPAQYFRPQYYGPSDWIGIRLDRPGVDWDHVAEWLQRSWQISAPARLTKLMTIAEEF